MMEGISKPTNHATRGYLTGFVLAVVLTVVPFALVATRALDVVRTLILIGLLALTQAIVHLHYFLHLDLRPSSRERLVALAFAAFIVFIMAGGTFWIMADLNYRMRM